MKTCSKCKKELPLSEFHKHKRYKDGYYYCCKECRTTNILPTGRKGLVKGNEYEIQEKYAIGLTSNGCSFKVDTDELDLVKQYTWLKDNGGYLVSNSCGKHNKLHRVILGIDDKNITVDHINRDKTDNRKENLRVVNRTESSINRGNISSNRSGRKGVHFWQPKGRKPRWVASITVNGKRIQLGIFKTKVEAIESRELAEQKYFKGILY